MTKPWSHTFRQLHPQIPQTVFQVTEEKLMKSWITVDAQTNQKEHIKRETVYCLDDDNETEVQVDDAIQGETVVYLDRFIL